MRGLRQVLRHVPPWWHVPCAGEAAGLRCQLAASDAQLSRAQRQVECLKEEAGGTASRWAVACAARGCLPRSTATSWTLGSPARGAGAPHTTPPIPCLHGRMYPTARHPSPPAGARRLAATDLVRREAERDRDGLEIQVQRLRATLAEAQVGKPASTRKSVCVCVCGGGGG